MSLYLKDPGARLQYTVAWGASLAAGQTIAASGWTVAPAEAGGVTVEASAFEPARTMATLTGGAAGKVYRVTNRVTLSDGQFDERMLTLRLEDR